jgi:hypothetical protein
VLEAPNPTSSVRISSTLGAPSGAFASAGKSFTESEARSPTFPLNGGSGIGNVSRVCACAWAANAITANTATTAAAILVALPLLIVFSSSVRVAVRACLGIDDL